MIFPGAGYVELAVAARDALTGSPSCSIEDLEFKVALPLEADSPAHVAATIAPDSAVFSIHRESTGSDPVLCARAKVYSSGRIPENVDIEELRRRLTDDVSPDALYASLAKRGLRYGSRFQPVRSLRRTTGEVLAGLALPEGVDAQGYHLHPVLLDGAFQSLIASVDEGPREDLIPVGIDRIHYIGGPSTVPYSHGRIVRADADGVTGDITLLAEDGTVIAQVFGFTCRFLPRIPRHDRTPAPPVHAHVGAARSGCARVRTGLVAGLAGQRHSAGPRRAVGAIRTRVPGRSAVGVGTRRFA